MKRLGSLWCCVAICLVSPDRGLGAEPRLKDTRALSTPTFGSPQDTFIVGCEFYLFGRLVPPVEVDGKRGHRVTKSTTAVHVNGILYLDTEAPPPTYEPSKEAVERVATSNAVAAEVRNSVTIPENQGGVLFRGSKIEFDREFTYSHTKDGKPILVEFRKYAFAVRIQGSGAHVYDYEEKEAALVDPDVHRERLLDGAYAILVRGLKPGVIFFAGRGYSNEVRGASAMADFRAALAEIPERANRLSYSALDGQPLYEPLTVRGFYFSGSEVRDLVEAEKK